MKRSFMVALAPLLVAACNASPRPSFDESACPFTNTAGLAGLSYRCGMLHTPEVHAAPDKLIEIPVLIVKGSDPSATPVVELDGGPGQSWDDLGFFPLKASGPEQTPFDQIYIEQRGTGRSVPRLDCDDANAATDNDAMYAQTCLSTFEKKGIDFTAYNVVELAGDIDTMVQVLGYSRVILDGVSYGTAWAQETMRRYPQILSGVVLDSVVAPAIPTFTQNDLGVQTGIEALLSECAADPACNASYPNLSTVLTNDLASLKQTPLSWSGATTPLDDVALYSTLTTLTAFDPESVPQFLYQVQSVVLASPSASPQLVVSARVAEDVADDAAAIGNDADGQYWAVSCSDNQYVTVAETNAEATQILPAFAPYIEDTELVELCAYFPSAKRPASDFTSVTTAVPTLLLSGDVDPLTPPPWAQAVATALPRGWLNHFPGAGHFVQGNIDDTISSCADGIVTQFLAAPGSVDESCVSTLQARFLGPGQMSFARPFGVHPTRHIRMRRPQLPAPNVSQRR